MGSAAGAPGAVGIKNVSLGDDPERLVIHARAGFLRLGGGRRAASHHQKQHQVAEGSFHGCWALSCSPLTCRPSESCCPSLSRVVISTASTFKASGSCSTS